MKMTSHDTTDVQSSGIERLKLILKAMGFSPVDGLQGQWAKVYLAHKYSIKINIGADVSSTRIDYGAAIVMAAGRGTTQTLSQAESLVVLECVDRLLDIGYSPNSLVLEKQFPLGHSGGFLDILVLSEDGRPYLMIECKTWGLEYAKEKAKTLATGGQLFTYYQQDKFTRFITLYASRYNNGVVEKISMAIDTSTLGGRLSPSLTTPGGLQVENLLSMAYLKACLTKYKSGGYQKRIFRI